MNRTLVEALDERETQRDDLRRALARADARLARRVAAVKDDLERMHEAARAAQQASRFVAEASRAPRGVDRLRAIDWSSGEARPVEMRVDPARSAKEQLDAIFRRARRTREGAAIARSRLDDAERARAVLADVVCALQAPDADLAALEARARTAAPDAVRFRRAEADPHAPNASASGAKGHGAAGRSPYRAFVGTSGAKVLVGRGARYNDELTLHVARPHHLWLHAKDRPGAHVIVALDKGAACPSELLVEAAHLAAHFSDARGEPIVEVQYTPRRYVRKPRGSPPGAVVLDREKVIVLRKDETLLRGLLAREA